MRHPFFGGDINGRFSMAAPHDDLGPLPLGDANEVQEQASLKALCNCLPEEKILFRVDKADDKGVDGELEVKVETRIPMDGGETKYKFTNCKAQAQLKSIGRNDPNADGSISYPIATSNLNYLLNGQSPIYFLWIAKTDQVRYVWARDEWRRLDAEIPDWMSRGSFTISFRDVLDPTAVDAIRERIVKEARFERRLHEVMARSAPSTEHVTVCIDPETFQTSDPQQVYQWLTTSGMTLASSGYGQQVISWFDLLNVNARQEARLRLVAAYAEASLGRYSTAASHLAIGALRRVDLSTADSQFLDYLRGVCDYQTGRIDLDEYLRRERDRASAVTGPHSAAHELELLRQQRLRERDQVQRRSLLNEMRAKEKIILAASDASVANKLQARILLLSAEGDDLAGGLIEDLLYIQTRQVIGQPFAGFAQKILQTTTTRASDWEAKVNQIVAEAAELKHPLLLADALTVRLTIYQVVLEFEQLNAVWIDEPFDPGDNRLLSLMADAQKAMEIYAKAGSLEGETRSKMHLSDLYSFRGQTEAAKKLAEGALVVAEAMMYPNLISLVRERIAGQTTLQHFIAIVRKRMASDEDTLLANETDANLKGPCYIRLSHSALIPRTYLCWNANGCTTVLLRGNAWDGVGTWNYYRGAFINNPHPSAMRRIRRALVSALSTDTNKTSIFRMAIPRSMPLKKHTAPVVLIASQSPRLSIRLLRSPFWCIF